MDCKQLTNQLTGKKLRLLVAVAVVLLGGVLFSWWTVSRTDREMRNDLLRQTQLLSQAVNIERIKALSGTEADLKKPEYLRIKEQLAAVRTINPQYRFAYLVGRNGDGSFFIFLDSEQSGSRDYSPPGQAYTEAPQGLRNAFVTRNSTVEGPYTDRWGTWVSALVPIHDPQTAMDGLATPADAQALVRKAVDFYRRNGRERFMKEISNPQGDFHRGDLYVFVYDRTMTMQAHPVKPELVGKNQLDKKDWAGGKFFRREIQEVARSKGSGWVDYEYENPVSKAIDSKTTYVQGVDNLIICAGAYKGTGTVLAMLGMDIDAHAWNWMLARAALPPALLTLTLATLLVMGVSLFDRRSQLELSPRWMRHLEPALVAIVGLVLTMFAAWVAYEREIHNRNDSFMQLAVSSTDSIAETLRDLRATGMESLARFYENSTSVTPEEFRQFNRYLTKNTSVQAWGWVPAVPTADRSRFQTAAHAAGLRGFQIWQKDLQGKQTPAIGRDMYYPVLLVSPLAGNEPALGYDIGSEPLRLAALEEAARTGLPTATAPITLVQEPGSQKGILICRPIFSKKEPKHLRGFATAVLRMGALLRNVSPDNSLFMEISFLCKDMAPESLATSWDADSPPDSVLSLTRPVFAFGKVFAVTAHAGPGFMRLHPLWMGWFTVLMGLALTTAITGMVSVILHRREELELLVFERTAALRESKEHLYATLRSIGDGVIATDATGRVTNLNSVAERLTGWTTAETMGRSVEEVFCIVHTKTRATVDNPVERVLREGVVVDLANHIVLIARDGAEYQIADSCAPIVDVNGHVIGAVLVFRDVTEEYRQREQLRASEDRFVQLAEQSGTITWEVDAQGLFTYVSHVSENVVGYRPDELVGQMHFYDPHPEPGREEYKKSVFAIFEQKKPFQDLESIAQTKDGRVVWVSTNGIPILNADGSLRGYRGGSTDITQHKQAEEQLRASEEKHRTILQTTMAGFFLVGTQGQLLEVNETYCRMSGYSVQELLKMRISDVEAIETADGTAEHIQKVMIQGQDRFESKHRRKDGSLFDVELNVRYLPAGDGWIAAFLQDISERKQAEEERVKLETQLHQAQKMESVGRLAGGVAHDFNNMLSVIIGHAELALMQSDSPRPLCTNLKEIIKAAERSADLTQQLLAFARKQTITPKVLDLNETVTGMLKMLQRLIGEDIDLNWHPKANLWPVKVDQSQIDQILANLCVNARDAISGVGKMIIETGNSILDEDYCAAHIGFVPGEYVRLAVSDNGCGMDKETLDHIFEPFFTTKELGKGTGLGLATVYGAVKQNNGFIDAYSEPGQRTTFTIFLPRHMVGEEQTPQVSFVTPPARGTETILLVEDEPSILEMAKTILEIQGYTVLAACTPREAIHLAGVYAGEIHLLMTDVIMPEMNGRELSERLLPLYPGLTCLFMSGYTADVIAHHGVLDEGVHFIQKPFNMNVLSRKLREVLDC